MAHVVLTPAEVAERWRVKAQSVRELLDSGALRGFHPRPGGTHWRVTLAEVERYERGERQEPASKPTPRRRGRMVQAVDGPF